MASCFPEVNRHYNRITAMDRGKIGAGLTDQDPANMKHSHSDNTQSRLQQVFSGKYGLAATYWTLYLVVAVAFFISGSQAVDAGNWFLYINLLGGTLVWTFILLVGVKLGYRGEDPGRALGRVAVLFLLLNLTNALATLSFI